MKNLSFRIVEVNAVFTTGLTVLSIYGTHTCTRSWFAHHAMCIVENTRPGYIFIEIYSSRHASCESVSPYLLLCLGGMVAVIYKGTPVIDRVTGL